MLAEAICNLVTASALNTEFAVYEDGRAIFSQWIKPSEAQLPAMIVTDSGGSTAGFGGTRATKGVEAQARIRIFGNRTTDSDLDDLARKVFWLVSRSDLTLSGGDGSFGVFADAPQRIDDEDDFPGYLIQVRAFVMEVT